MNNGQKRKEIGTDLTPAKLIELKKLIQQEAERLLLQDLPKIQPHIIPLIEYS